MCIRYYVNVSRCMLMFQLPFHMKKLLFNFNVFPLHIKIKPINKSHTVNTIYFMCIIKFSDHKQKNGKLLLGNVSFCYSPLYKVL